MLNAVWKQDDVGLMSKIVAGTLTAALLVTGGYVWADINDLVPGFLTNAEPIPPALPFPTVTGPDPATRPADPLPILDGKGAPITGDTIATLAAKLAKNKDTLGPSVAVVVSDTFTGDPITAVNADTPIVAASVQKILTGLAAMDVLDPNSRISTTVVQAGNNTLYLVGGGDMMLAANTGDPDAVNGHAGMRNLAEDTAASLKLTGRTTINLYLDDSLFTGSPTGPWADDIPSLGYAAPVHAIGVDVGRQREGTYAPRYADPATHALTTFADHLTELGITVTNTPSRRVLDRDGYAATIDDERVIASVQSATVGEIVDYFLKTSDNTITEVMGRLVAVERGLPGTFDGATTAVIQALTTMGLDTTGVDLVDCSGLGDTSTVTASLINEAINTMAHDPAYRQAVRGMAVAAYDGTLNDRYTNRNGRGLVRAKTGSLPGVTALAGTLLTLDDRTLTFTIIADDLPDGGPWAARQAMDAFVEQLSECGCS